MYRPLFLLLVCTLGGLAVPSAFDRYVKEARSGPERVDEAPRVVAAAAPATELPPASPAPIGRAVVLDADAGGHFRTDARMNGQRLPVLVDTGATYVALDETTARRIGVHLAPEDWRHPVQTANGQALAASARIGRIEIGPVAVTDVDALVLKDGTLGVNLLGMSFLKRLDRFAVENGRLTMRQ